MAVGPAGPTFLSPRLAALSGLAAGAAGLAAGELAAGLAPPVPSPIVAAASLVIALQPPGAKDVAAALFGTGDKLALEVAVLVAALLAATLLGRVARTSFSSAATGFGVLGAVCFVGAAYAELVPLPAALVGAVIPVAVASGALWWLLSLARRLGVEAASWSEWTGSDLAESHPGSRPTLRAEQPADPFRRQFVIRALAILAAATAAGSVGRYLLDLAHASGTPARATLPEAATTVVPLVAGEQLSAPGITPLVTSNSSFYRIDTNLLVPVIDPSTWQLKISGMVDHPRSYSLGDLQGMPLIEQYVTIACVSNEVGGSLVGNALWTGVRLKEILAAAGAQAGATQIVGRAVDGFTVGFPTSWALDPAREPMVVLGMNRQPLPAEHGYPARLVVPGLFGYVSATKWLSEVELTTREAFDAYWIKLGWAKDGPILTQSRIDHPADSDRLASGPVWIDGMAWAPDRGVSRVEVRIDQGPWQSAELSRAISKATWVQWMYSWQAPPGTHTIEVRATDGTGAVQTAQVTDPSPDGARGHHTIRVTVT
jgi:DMSO/TMAO reductase YedYZ molybdopterin-dependent catalytic subunit